jgi:hypothetical protein
MISAQISAYVARENRFPFCANAALRLLIMPIAIAVTGLDLAGCSSRPTAPSFEIQLESTPPGAEARTSFGPGCKTPCSVNTPLPDGNFTVTYTLDNFQPATIPVQISGGPAGFMTPGTTRIDPNPVVAELQPIVPPKPERKPMRPKKPKKPAAAAPAGAGSAFPAPVQAAPPPPASSTR